MKTVAFFNNKGGVGKTSLVYHLAWMFAELDYRVIAADLDPQSNLSSMFLNEERMGDLWNGNNGKTIDEDIAPLFDGTGDINSNPHIEKIAERIGLLAGNLALSKREDDLSAEWPRATDGKERAFRVLTAFSRLIGHAAKDFSADLALIDVGPNLGAINRTALLASNHVVIPLAPDLFSLQGLKNVGSILDDWREGWKRRIDAKPSDLDIALPAGDMQPAGYVIVRHAVRLDRPVQAYGRWIDKMPATYRQAVAADASDHCLAHLKDYRSLMPMSQEANKPMFMLKHADGVTGTHHSAVSNCYTDFKKLAMAIIRSCNIPSP